MIEKKRPPITRDKALPLMASLCVKCEQCEADLREKMRRRGLSPQDTDYVIDYLYEHKFLDQTRFASAYAKDKFRFNAWGRIKIAMMLRAKKIPECEVKEALAKIPEDDYRACLLRLARTASRSLSLDNYADRAKLMRRLYSRGFEPQLIRMALEDLIEA